MLQIYGAKLAIFWFKIIDVVGQMYCSLFQRKLRKIWEQYKVKNGSYNFQSKLERSNSYPGNLNYKIRLI